MSDIKRYRTCKKPDIEDGRNAFNLNELKPLERKG